jgi:hypothetical protein
MKIFRAGCVFLIAGALALAQQPPPYPEAPPPPSGQPAPSAAPLPPEQLENLVAPIALYPDPLLSQVLVAATYPLEVVEAQQWLQNNRNLSGQQLLDAARDQNWDPSIQALVAFPEVLNRLNQDVRWTTDLGNAFISQQPDVMNAVQRMRLRAEQNGKLQSNAQETVQTESQDGQNAIDIQPADPQMIYVPSYDPAYVWGPPAYGYYPQLYYPGVGLGFSFGSGIYVGSFFGGCCGWGGFGWGWAPHWFDHHVVVNNYFLHRYGFRDFHRGDFRDQEVWAHNPEHRLGVPYPNRDLQNRFRGDANTFRGGGGRPEGRVVAPAGPRFGTRDFERQNPGGNRSVFGGVGDGGRTRIQNDHGFSSMRPSGGGMRSAPAPRAPSAPRGGGRGRGN